MDPRKRRGRRLRLALVAATALLARDSAAGPVTVRFNEGLVHGFLSLSTLAGERLADGDLYQQVVGDRVTTRLVFHFDDGSLHEETAVYTQRRAFSLISDHLVQKGPTFPQPMDVSIDSQRRKVLVRYADDEGHEKTESASLDLPADLANGMVITLLKNLRPETPLTTVSFLAATPKPRLVQLEIRPAGEAAFAIGRSQRKATRYVMHVKIGGVTGVVAGLLGKQPADTSFWILGGEAPAFVKMEGPLYPDGPPWRIELASPSWPR